MLLLMPQKAGKAVSELVGDFVSRESSVDVSGDQPLFGASLDFENQPLPSTATPDREPNETYAAMAVGLTRAASPMIQGCE